MLFDFFFQPFSTLNFNLLHCFWNSNDLYLFHLHKNNLFMQSFVFFLEAKHPQIYEGKSIFNKKNL